MPSAKQQKAEISFNNYLIIVIMVCVLAVGAAGFAGKIMITNFLRNQKLVAGKTAADNQLTSNLETFAKLKTEYNSLGATKGFLDAALPTTADYPGLVSTMANIAGVSGLKLKSITPADTTNAIEKPIVAGEPPEYTVNLVLEGNYDSVTKFLKNIELSARQFKITTVNLTGPTASQTLTVDVVAFHQVKAVITDKTEAVK